MSIRRSGSDRCRPRFECDCHGTHPDTAGQRVDAAPLGVPGHHGVVAYGSRQSGADRRLMSTVYRRDAPLPVLRLRGRPLRCFIGPRERRLEDVARFSSTKRPTASSFSG